MPNWCNTQITINHENQKELQKLYNNIEKWTSANYKENDFGTSWLGNVVGNSGIGTVNENPETDLRCRGWIFNIELLENQLFIDTETAWGPLIDMWVKLLENYLPDAELIYRAEEPGHKIYLTNDPVLDGNFVIEAWDVDSPLITKGFGSNYEATKEDVVETLQKILKTDEDDFDKLMQKLSESEYNDSLQIHAWNYKEEM